MLILKEKERGEKERLLKSPATYDDFKKEEKRWKEDANLHGILWLKEDDPKSTTDYYSIAIWWRI